MNNKAGLQRRSALVCKLVHECTGLLRVDVIDREATAAVSLVYLLELPCIVPPAYWIAYRGAVCNSSIRSLLGSVFLALACRRRLCGAPAEAMSGSAH